MKCMYVFTYVPNVLGTNTVRIRAHVFLFFPPEAGRELRRAAAPAASAAPGDLASLGGEVIAVGCVAWEAEHAHLRWHSGMSAEWR